MKYTNLTVNEALPGLDTLRRLAGKGASSLEKFSTGGEKTAAGAEKAAAGSTEKLKQASQQSSELGAMGNVKPGEVGKQSDNLGAMGLVKPGGNKPVTTATDTATSVSKPSNMNRAAGVAGIAGLTGATMATLPSKSQRTPTNTTPTNTTPTNTTPTNTTPTNTTPTNTTPTNTTTNKPNINDITSISKFPDYKQNTPNITQKPSGEGSFADAFAKARAAHGGPGGVFSWNGKDFQTNYKDEPYVKNPVPVGTKSSEPKDSNTTTSYISNPDSKGNNATSYAANPNLAENELNSLLKLSGLNENTTGQVHKGTYGTSYGKEDVRDQYGHRIGKVNKGAEAKKSMPKQGRGRPKKDTGDAGVKFDSSHLAGAFGTGKKPSKPVGTVSKKHSLKEYIEEVQNYQQLDEAEGQFTTKPIPQQNKQFTQVLDPSGQPALSAPVPTDTALRVVNALNTSDVNEDNLDTMNEKAVSKAQQKFFGMVHAMQKGKKIPGASKELKGVAKSMGKGDVKDFAKTKHKGLPQHVKKTNEKEVEEGAILNRSTTPMPGSVNKTDPSRVQVAPNVQKSVVDYNKKVADVDAKNDAYRQDTNPTASDVGRSIGKFVGDVVAAPKAAWSAGKQAYDSAVEPFAKPEKPVDIIPNPRQGTTIPKESVKDVEESGLQAYLGNKKYGKDGMDALRKAGHDHSSKEKMAKIRAKYDKMNEQGVAEGKDEGKPGKNFAKIAKSAGQKYGSKAAGERVAGAVRNKLKAQGKLEETKPDFLDVNKNGNKKESWKKAEKNKTKKKVSESIVLEGVMKDLLINFYDTVTSHMGDGSIFDLKKATNVQQAEEVLKGLVKHSDEYNDLDHSNQNELVNQTLKYLAHEKQLPFNTLDNIDSQRFITKPNVDLGKFRQHPGAKPGSNFSQPGSPMAMPRTTGSNGFLKTLSTPTIKESNDMKDKQFESWERELNGLLNEGITVSHSTGQQGSPDSLSINATEHDASELMSILRNSGMEMFGGNKDHENVGGYGVMSAGEEPEGHGTNPEHSPEVVGDGDDMLALIKKMSGIATDKGTPGSVEVDYEDEEGDEDEVDENLEVHANPSGASSIEQAKQIGAQFPQQGGKEPNLAYKIGEDDMDEGNMFTGNLAKARAAGKEEADLDGDGDMEKVKEDDMEEGNMFTGNLAKARAQGKEEADLDGDGDMEKVHEGEDTCNECGMYESECDCDHEAVEEGYANDAGGDAMAETELLKLKELLSLGNDLHRQKHSQATGNITKVTMETKLFKDSTDLLVDWKKLSGIK